MATLQTLFVDHRDLPGLRSVPARPCVFVDLATVPRQWWPPALPPLPVIAVGDGAHPAAGCADVLVEPPVSPDALLDAIAAAPRAAAVLALLLRRIETLPTDAALEAESLAYGLLQGSAEHRSWLDERPAPQTCRRGNVLIERDAARLEITLDRPWARNSIDATMRDRINEALDVAISDPDVESVVFRGRGAAFCAGGDLSEFGTTRDPATAHLIRMQANPAFRLARLRGVLSTEVSGACIGAGLEMAAFASEIVATPNSWFQLPELRMGLIPGAGGCVSVTRRVGRQRAGLMMLSGRRIPVKTARAWGLVDRIGGAPPD